MRPTHNLAYKSIQLTKINNIPPRIKSIISYCYNGLLLDLMMQLCNHAKPHHLHNQTYGKPQSHKVNN